MARYTEAVCRQCRREGQKLFLKGDRCYTQKCALECRGYAPGQHGQGRSKTSEYGSQLREKQKVRRYYGRAREAVPQLLRHGGEASGHHGREPARDPRDPPGQRRLPSRLCDEPRRGAPACDARPLHRGWPQSQHPQLPGQAGHGYYTQGLQQESRQDQGQRRSQRFPSAPKWLDYDANNMVGKVVAIPARDDIDLPVEEHLIVELYSK